MQIERIDFENPLPFSLPTAVALGFFDGVHVGHAAILQKTAAIAAEQGLLPAALVFADDGSFKENAPRLLREEEKFAQIERAGIAVLFVARFPDLCGMAPADFVEKILFTRLHARAAVCGYNFRFGQGAKGTQETLFTLLSTHGVPLFALNEQKAGGRAVSSSRIREALVEGKMEECAAMLGRPWGFSGEVLHGREVGRKMHFPTANLALPRGVLLPPFGVYAVCASFDGRTVGGVANIGKRPTFGDTGEANCEVHLFEGGDLYGKRITLSFLSFLREERTFPSEEALQAQIAADKAKAKEIEEKWNGRN